MPRKKLNKRKILYPKIAKKINDMVKIDQKMRKKAVKDWNLFDQSVDRANTKITKTIIAKIGWPTISKVGKKGSNNAWLLVQHADFDVRFQRKCLNMMKKIPKGDASVKNIAYLQDRILIHEGKTQIYGTQYRVKNKKRTLLPTKDIKHLKERRRSVGLY